MQNSDIVKEITKRDVLISEKNKAVKDAIKLDIDIAVLERTDPNGVIANRQKQGAGNSVSYEPITAKQMLEKYREDREGHQTRIDIITSLMK